jgi:hypothetical protein
MGNPMRSIQSVNWPGEQWDEARVLRFGWAKHAADIANANDSCIAGKNRK